MRIVQTAAQWLLVLCLPFLLTAAVIGVLTNSLRLYDHAAEKYGVGEALEATGLQLSDQELSGIYAELIRYYNSSDDYVHITVTQDGNETELLTSEEILHFKDVKGLIRLDYGIFLGTFAVVIACIGLNLFLWRDRRRLWWGLRGGGVLTLALLVGLFLLNTIFGFNRLFTQFHFLFFDNMYWSAQGYMLVLFPGGLFVNAAIIGIAGIAGAALILGGAGWWQLRKERPGET